MKWIKINKETTKKIEEVNPYTHVSILNLSPRPYIPTEDEGDINAEILQVEVEGVPSTFELSKILQELQKDYDKSDEVNHFMIDGEKSWLDKDTRVGLINSVTIQKDSGATTTVLWLNDSPYKVSIDYALTFLKELELYAIECNNVTQTHIAQIKKIIDRNELFEYNVSKDYPKSIIFDLDKVIK